MWTITGRGPVNFTAGPIEDARDICPSKLFHSTTSGAGRTSALNVDLARGPSRHRPERRIDRVDVALRFHRRQRKAELAGPGRQRSCVMTPLVIGGKRTRLHRRQVEQLQLGMRALVAGGCQQRPSGENSKPPCRRRDPFGRDGRPRAGGHVAPPDSESPPSVADRVDLLAVDREARVEPDGFLAVPRRQRPLLPVFTSKSQIYRSELLMISFASSRCRRVTSRGD